ncbi:MULTISPECIES: hypothetical protein [unclassified Amycolatopsis]|uniref:hypothetical protein n=1 Tax=unclassified Amycolatopsis TaxID=2618356 RepID=UPI0018FE2269|nr:hypothetical protein [Amycolatopsis sp. Poz14]
MSTQALVPEAAAAAAHGTSAVLGSGSAFGLGAGFGVGFGVGFALVLAGLLLVAGAELLVGALEDETGTLAAAGTAPPPAADPAVLPEHATSPKAAASAAIPTRTLFTIRYPRVRSGRIRQDPYHPNRRPSPLRGCSAMVTIRLLHPGVEPRIHLAPARTPTKPASIPARLEA